MAATAVTLNDLEGHSPVATLFKCNPSNFVQHFTRFHFQLTVCSRASSALAELLVNSGSVPNMWQSLAEFSSVSFEGSWRKNIDGKRRNK